MNKVLLVGRLTRDPELRTTQSGIAVARFTIAVNQNFTNRNGERGTDFINCVVWERQAANIAKYCHKGSLVSAEGRITTRSYDAQDGTKRYVTEVVCENVNFLSPKSENSNYVSDTPNDVPNYVGGSTSFASEPVSAEPMETADLSEDPFKSFGEEITLTSDDLPF